MKGDRVDQRLGEEVRVTVLGHVQRGGAPTVFDRNLGTLMGSAAIETIMTEKPDNEPVLIGLIGNKITKSPLMQCVEQTRSVADALDKKDFARAMGLRSSSFREAFDIYITLMRSLPHPPHPGQRRMKIGILNSGSPAPGMNTASRAAVRLALDKGHTVYGINHGFQGFIDGDIQELNWMSVHGWASMGGSELGTNRKVPKGGDLYLMARNIEKYEIEGVLMIGGWTGYESIYKVFNERTNYPAFNIPIVCLPAAINNNLPGTELSIGADKCFDTEGDRDAFTSAQPIFPYKDDQERPYFDAYSSLAGICLGQGQPIAQHMSTAEVARDLDLLRQAVGDQQLTYLGFSYGSYLGNTYANLFPDKVRALVLDGVLNPLIWTIGRQISSDRVAVQAVAEEFNRLCDEAAAVNPAYCFMSGPQGAAATFLAVAESLKQTPLVLPNGELYTYDMLIAQAAGCMYTPEVWPDCANFVAFLASALRGDAGATAKAAATIRPARWS